MTVSKVVSRLKKVKKSGNGYMALCPAHDDKKPSLSIAEGEGGKVLLRCFAGCSPESVVTAIGLKIKDLFPGSDRQITPFNGNGPTKTSTTLTLTNRRKAIAAIYQYRDENGNFLYENVRYQPKDFRQRRSDGNGGHIYNLSGIDRVPYRLPELLDAIKNGTEEIWFTEGEKDADNLRALGFTVTSFKNWRKDFNPYIEGCHAVLFRHHDKSGLKQAKDAAGKIATLAKSVKIIDLFDGEPLSDTHGQDVSDWIDARLAEEFDNETVAQQLAVHVNRSDTWQSKTATSQTTGGLTLKTSSSVNQLAAEMNGADVLDAIECFTGRFISYPSEPAHVGHVLWIAHAWFMDYWDSTPRLAVLSPEPGSGKSRLLEVTEALVPRPIHSVNTTSAYLFRKVSDPAGPPTILYDEIDTVFGPKARDNEDLRGMLNAGHRKGAMAGRCVVRGRVVETEELPSFCAVALAGLNDLPDTLMTRSLVIRMRRRGPNENIEPWRHRKNGEEARPIAEKLEAWAMSYESVAFAEPPPGISDRNADVWEPLLTVAELAGGKWPERSCVAAVALVASKSEDKHSLGVQLLMDSKTIFKTDVRLPTDEIIGRLLNITESIWCDLRGKSLDDRTLAKLLRPYGISSRQIRFSDKNLRGYERTDFDDAWSRYLPTNIPFGEPNDMNTTSATSATRK